MLEKILVPLTAILLLSGSLQARENPIHVHGGYSSSSLGDSDSDSSYNAGMELIYDFGQKGDWAMRYGIDYDGFNIKDNDSGGGGYLFFMSVGAEYEVVDNLNIFVEGVVGGSGDLAGYGFDTGLRYQVLDYVALFTKYRQVSLSVTGEESVASSTISAGIDLNFRTIR